MRRATRGTSIHNRRFETDLAANARTLATIPVTQTRPSGRLEDAIGIQKTSGGPLFACDALHEPEEAAVCVLVP